MRKPDRFERAVLKQSWDGYDIKQGGVTKGIWSNDAVKLLRAEHRWMMRAIRQRQRYELYGGIMITGSTGQWIRYDLLMDVVKKRRK